MIQLIDIASVIRSKNAGPFELTFDIIFKRREDYEEILTQNLITPLWFSKLYGIPVDAVICVIAFEPAQAIKITIKRPIGSGELGETDVYGAQQHAPLLSATLDLK
jgi:hypothetical protein